MLCCLYPFRRLLATTLLAVFVNMLLGQCWCASMRPAPAQGPPTTARAATMLPGHACCRAAAEREARKATAQTSKPSQSEKHSGSGDDCCRKKSASLLASLDAAGKQLLGSAALLPVVQKFYFRASLTGQWDRTAPVRLVPTRQLPPKIPDIRIFIRSLTV